MYFLARLLGSSAAIVWLALAAATAMGGLLLSPAPVINLVIGALFLGIAMLLWWRLRALAEVNAALQAHEAIRSLLRVEVVTSAGALLFGSLLLLAALYRIFGEGMAVFG